MWKFVFIIYHQKNYCMYIYISHHPSRLPDPIAGNFSKNAGLAHQHSQPIYRYEKNLPKNPLPADIRQPVGFAVAKDVAVVRPMTVSGWWFFTNPIGKIWSSKWVHLPQFSGWKFQKYLSCHHLGFKEQKTWIRWLLKAYEKTVVDSGSLGMIFEKLQGMGFFSSKVWTSIWKNMLVKLDHFSKYGWKFQKYSKPPPKRWLQLVGGFNRYLLHGNIPGGPRFLPSTVLILLSRFWVGAKWSDNSLHE